MRHELRLVEALGINKGDAVLDAGCGVGGPARVIANATQALVTGVTLNAYVVTSPFLPCAWVTDQKSYLKAGCV